MTNFEVTYRSDAYITYVVTADSKEEALQRISDGYGEIIDEKREGEHEITDVESYDD